jgi:hypothetical protein
MFDIKQAALHACISETILRGWISSGQLPHYRLGSKGKRGKIVIAKEDLDGFLANFRVSGPATPAPKPSVTPTYKHLKLS